MISHLQRFLLAGSDDLWEDQRFDFAVAIDRDFEDETFQRDFG